jgi:O-acetyl-ADP-ribose deacetylase (regulator of RNase III)
MELKEGMMFAGNVVDGLVHELGGWPLRIQCMMKDEVPVGKAVSTGPGGRRLRQEYNQIIHTVPPFYKHHENPKQYLSECYRNALSLAFSQAEYGSSSIRVACPLIGAGGRGFPLETAIRVAATESVRWRDSDGTGNNFTIAFGIPDETTAVALVDAIEQAEGEINNATADEVA